MPKTFTKFCMDCGIKLPRETKKAWNSWKQGAELFAKERGARQVPYRNCCDPCDDAWLQRILEVRKS